MKPVRFTPPARIGTGTLYSSMRGPEQTQMVMLCPPGHGYAMYGMGRAAFGDLTIMEGDGRL
jgi:hypothetical protein